MTKERGKSDVGEKRGYSVYRNLEKEMNNKKKLAVKREEQEETVNFNRNGRQTWTKRVLSG